MSSATTNPNIFYQLGRRDAIAALFARIRNEPQTKVLLDIAKQYQRDYDNEPLGIKNSHIDHFIKTNS